MSMKFVNTVVGAEHLKNTLTQLIPRESNNLLRRVTLEMAKELRNEIRAGAPVDTGTLRKAIVHKRNRGDRGAIEASVNITKGTGATHDAWHWHFIEFGTTRLPARPFIIPAAERMRAKMLDIFENKFFKQLAKAVAKRGGAILR